MTNKPTIGLCLIIKDDSEVTMIDRCLDSVADYVDNIYITITNKPCNEIEKVIEKYNGHKSYFEWVNDFSKARNFNFSQCNDDWILWLDTDDVLQGAEKLPSIMEKLTPDISALVMNYLYDFSEDGEVLVEQKRNQVIKNDGTWEWKGKIHEDLFSDRKITAYEVKDIKRLHLPERDDKDFHSAERNLDIAKRGRKENPDDPKYDWDIANALMMMGKLEEAIVEFDNFIKRSGAEEEMYLARCRQGEALYNLGKIEQAMVCYLYAIGLRPRYPNAFFGLATCYFANKRWEDAEDCILTGLRKPRPDDSMIVWNPRDFDYNPLMVLAKVYYNMPKLDKCYQILEKLKTMFPKDKEVIKYHTVIGQAKEKFDKIDKRARKLEKIKSKKRLKKKLDALPIEMKSHPRITWIRNTNFIKKESSGKEISYYCGETAEQWNPETVKKKGIGGSEEHVINVSRELAKQGWEVTVYNNCGKQEKVYDGVTYKPFWQFNVRDKTDVLIMWRMPTLADFELNADKVIIDLHDCISPQEWLSKRLERIDTIVCKSHWQRGLFPDVDDEKFTVLDNCFDLSEYKGECKNDPYTLIYTSSPDRGLKAFLEIYKKVKEQIPKAKAICRYGWQVFDVAHTTDPSKMEWKKEVQKDLAELDIDFSRLSHSEIADKYQQAGIWLYPSEFGEIHCITAIKSQAAGAIPITTDFSALNETVKYGLKYHSDKDYETWCPQHKFDFSVESKSIRQKMADKIIDLMKHPELQQKMRKEMVTETLKNYSANKIGKQWDKMLKSL